MHPSNSPSYSEPTCALLYIWFNPKRGESFGDWEYRLRKALEGAGFEIEHVGHEELENFKPLRPCQPIDTAGKPNVGTSPIIGSAIGNQKPETAGETAPNFERVAECKDAPGKANIDGRERSEAKAVEELSEYHPARLTEGSNPSALTTFPVEKSEGTASGKMDRRINSDELGIASQPREQTDIQRVKSHLPLAISLPPKGLFYGI